MITVLNCGYDSKHQVTLDTKRIKGSPDYTLLLTKTEAYFEVDGELVDTPPGTAILYDKHSYVHYGCRTPYYNDDWIHFDLTEDELPFLHSLDIPMNIPSPLTYIGQLSEYARFIVLEKHSALKNKEQILDSLMRAMLYSLSSQIHQPPNPKISHKYYEPIMQIRMSILSAPHKKWTVEEIAEKIHLSPSYFQHLYKEMFGHSCMQEVILARLKNARFYLRTTDMSIQSLANFCGYDNELHFMRQFKKYEGMTPTQYRDFHRNR